MLENDNKPNLQGYVVWFIASVFFTYVLMIRNLPAVTETELRTIFSMSDTFFGQVRGIYFISYCLMHLPMVYFLDIYGPRKIIGLSSILCVLGILSMAVSTSPNMLLFGRFILGIGSSTGILGVFKVNRSMFPENYFSRMLGITATMGFIGSFTSLNIFSRLFDTFGYYNGIYISSGFGVLIAILTFIFTPSLLTNVNHGFFEEVLCLIKNKKFLFVSLIGGLLIGAIEGFADGWSVPFLTSLYEFDNTLSKDITSIIYLGFAIGSPLLAFYADLTNNHRKLYGLSGLMMGAAFISLFLFKLNIYLLLLSYFIIGFFSSYQVLCMYLAGIAVPDHLKNISSGGANMIIMSFGYIFHSAIGFLMEGKGIEMSGKFIYPQESLIYGLMILPVSCILGYILSNWTNYSMEYKR